jgi:hypothetical protein
MSIDTTVLAGDVNITSFPDSCSINNSVTVTPITNEGAEPNTFNEVLLGK